MKLTETAGSLFLDAMQTLNRICMGGICQLPSLADNSKVTVVALDSDKNDDSNDGTIVDQIWSLTFGKPLVK